jgi:hypothetical protein
MRQAVMTGKTVCWREIATLRHESDGRLMYLHGVAIVKAGAIGVNARGCRAFLILLWGALCTPFAELECNPVAGLLTMT